MMPKLAKYWKQQLRIHRRSAIRAYARVSYARAEGLPFLASCYERDLENAAEKAAFAFKQVQLFS